MNQTTIQETQNSTQKKTTALVGGCFDFLHFGHISFLKKAKTFADRLVILLESDENVKRLKGEGRPFHTQKQRKEMLESLKCVDEVISLEPMTGNESYYTLIKKIHPSIIVFTEGDPKLHHKMEQTALIGAKAIIIPKIETPSTTKLAKLLDLE